MGYIGNTPAEKYQTLQKQSFTTSATTSYTLSYSVTNPQEIALFINNVRQNPNSSYTVSGTTLTLSSATASTDVMYAVFLGKSVGTIAPGVGSVTNDMLSGSIANAKLANSAITLNGSAVSLGGSATIGGGKIGQIEVNNYVGSISNSGTTFADVQTLTVTPEAQNSKYLVRINGGYTYSVSDKYMAVRVLVNENSGGFNAIQTVNSKDVATNHGTNSSYLTAPHSWEFLYTPSNTTSLTSIVFKTQFASINTSGAVQYNAGAFHSSSLEGTCVFSCMEVLA